MKTKIFCKKQIPNIITVVRIAIAIVIFCLLISSYYLIDPNNFSTSNPRNPMVYQWKYGFDSRLYFTAGILFLVACGSDFVDGYLSRKYNWVTNFGKLWDPLADKILINGVMIILCWQQEVIVVFVVIMIARDIIVDGMKMFASSKGTVVGADIFGKLKTIFQMVALIFVFFVFNLQEPYWKTMNKEWMFWIVQNGLIIIATCFSIISGVNYVIKINKTFKNHV